jgi:hypothetical protein
MNADTHVGMNADTVVGACTHVGMNAGAVPTWV